ncbi:MAG TPA: HAMP domain-containing sensor histidine kinase, partial [Spirochaetota bacterium]|nr:HAMP domain-containing sensor histidine kinase [Spirochaetota bacterium]
VFYDSKKRPSGIVGIILDITKIKNLENELLEKNRELNELNKTKDKFFSIIAHDLRGPLLYFPNIINMMLDTLNTMSKETLVEYLKRLFEASNRTNNLIENLLEWSRLQFQQVKLNKNYFEMFDNINNVVSLFSNVASLKNIKIINQVEKNLYVYADLNMINTVLRNLLNNAIKFSYEKGEILINSEKNNDNNYLKINIIDFGTGMSKLRVEKLFNIENNVSVSGTDGEKGSGLGLIICKDFIEKNSGKISVLSEEGKGSIFSIYLPNSSI